MRRLTAWLALLCLGTAQAQSPAPGQALFEALDLNGDGFVTLSEAAGNEVVVTRFDRGDRNRDGKLSAKEFANLKSVKVRVAKGKSDRSAATGSSGRRPYSEAEKKAAEGG
jgi:hypothetical protein